LPSKTKKERKMFQVWPYLRDDEPFEVQTTYDIFHVDILKNEGGGEILHSCCYCNALAASILGMG